MMLKLFVSSARAPGVRLLQFRADDVPPFLVEGESISKGERPVMVELEVIEGPLGSSSGIIRKLWTS